MSTRDPYVVILTGGGLPGEEDKPPDPHPSDIALALERAGADPPAATLARRVIAEAFKAGYRQAAMLHRVVAVYALPGKGTAGRFAAYLTAEVDPAYARRAADPAGELLAWWERGQAGQDPA